MEDNEKDKIVPVTIKITQEAKNKVEELAKKYRRSVTKEIEWLIMEAE